MSQRRVTGLTQHLRRSREEIAHQLRGIAGGLRPGQVRSFAATHTLRWVVNCAVAALVLSLPIAASAAAISAPTTDSATLFAAAEAPRAQGAARGGTISAGRSPLTVNAEGVKPIREYTLGKSDTLGSLANFFNVSPEAIAFANGISDPVNLPVGTAIRIPPADGALFELAAGDTIESVAAKFKVDVTVIKDYNRLYFEPEHFAPGKLLFVPGAVLPGLVYQAADPEQESPAVVARGSSPIAPLQRAQPAPVLRPALSWPVAGVVTQYMSSWHTGVDIAAPYGTSLVAVRSGVVTAAGWVAVGGLRICVTSGGGVEDCYYHTGALFAGIGQAVGAGQVVASIGMTGVTTGPHVHWETKVNRVLVNPLGR